MNPYDIRMSGEDAEIFIYGAIGDSWDEQSTTAANFVSELKDLGSQRISVRINSPGGSVFDGLAIYNALREHPAKVTVKVDGVALSAASLIAMAGDEVVMAKNAMMMIHAPWVIAAGNSSELRKEADVLDKLSASMATSYATKTGKPLKEMMALLMDGEDHWYSADEAKKDGFADRIDGQVKPKAEFDFSKFRRVPEAAMVFALGGAPPSQAKPPGDSGKQTKPAKAGFFSSREPKGKNMQTFTERLEALQEDREKFAARMNELTVKCSADFSALDEEEVKEYDDLAQTKLPAVDAEIRRLKAHESAINGAITIEPAGEKKSIAFRAGARIEKKKLEPGRLFARYALSMAAGRGSVSDATAHAKQRWRDTPEVAEFLMTPANPMTTSGAGAELVNPTILVSEFVELLRPNTIIGRLQGMRRVPFNVKIQTQTDGAMVGWVGEGSAKPVGEVAFDTISVPFTKVAGIIVLTDEQVRFSSPNADMLVRDDLVRQCAQFLDEQFVDPNVDATSSHPESITHDVSATPASGPDVDSARADLFGAVQSIAVANMGRVDSCAWITNSATALGLSQLTNALGQYVFPTINVSGGTLMGFPVVVSDSVARTDTNGGSLILVKANELFLADDGNVTLDASREATLDMSGSNTPAFSLWQKNCVAIRAEQFISWKKRRDNCVAVISGTAYGPTASA